MERLFDGALAAGPVVANETERAPLLRYANRATARQYEGYCTRPWTVGEAAAAVASFACECGRTECEAQVELAPGDFPDRRPVLAPGCGGAGRKRAGHT
ncbi:hypothetical protein [Streptomyces sp. NPDC018059]|uniref:hypothetical protein n=1 Tax=Streptomyces sp. NPDC018059 TaxID=3365041 RepID=UPI0037B06D29